MFPMCICDMYLCGGGRDCLIDSADNRGCLLGGVYIPCIHRMPGGVVVGDSGLSVVACMFNVRRQLLERNYFPLFVDSAQDNHAK